MNYRLTYALSSEEIYTAEFKTGTVETLEAYEEALVYLAKNHTVEELEGIVAFSIVKLQEPENAN